MPGYVKGKCSNRPPQAIASKRGRAGLRKEPGLSKDGLHMFPMKRHIKPVLLCSLGLLGLVVFPHVSLVNLVAPQTREHVSTRQYDSSIIGASIRGVLLA